MLELKLLNSSETSDWLKKQIVETKTLNQLDTLNDINLLLEIISERLNADPVLGDKSTL